MPSPSTRSRSPSPFTKRAERSYNHEDRYPRRRSSRSPSPYTKRAERSYGQEDQSPRRRSPRSSSPRPRRHHERSRSPRRRQEDRPKKSSGGFRWKEKPRQDEDDRRDDRRLERGYREQERPRQRSPPRDVGRRDDIEAKFGRQASPTRQDSRNNGVEEKFGKEEPQKEKKKKSKPAIAPTSQEMIIVNVNDRLGTKASIPCLASDPISMPSYTSVQATRSKLI